MAADPRIKGYAKALFEVARAEGVLDQVEDELYRFARVLEKETHLRDALIDANVPADHRTKMIEELLGGKVIPQTVNLIGFVVQSGRARDLPGIVDAVLELAAHERKQAVAEVRAAVTLDKAEREKLKDALEKATGKEIELRVIVDPAVMGGLVARVGDVVFDASVRRRLELAKEQLGRS